jgi:hypothetical protein
MPNKQREASWKDVRAALGMKDAKELLSLIQQLYSLDEDNRRFIHAKFSLGDLLQPYKNQIETHMCPDPYENEEVSISAARKAISEYRKATGDPLGTLDLMIYFVECGTQFTLDFGDMWEEFYDSLESMFSKAVKMLKGMDKKTIDVFLPRLEKLVRDTDGMGWGYHDGLGDALCEEFPDANSANSTYKCNLNSRSEKKDNT